MKQTDAAYTREHMLADLALANEIPLYTIPDDAEFTLDQHLAFGRLTDAIPGLLAEIDDLRGLVKTLEGALGEAYRQADAMEEELLYGDH